MSQPLPFRLDREIVVAAPLGLVFRYFTDNERWARWWGAGSTIDATPGGTVLIRHPNGVEVAGHVVTVDPPHVIAFTYGYKSGAPIPEGASLVTIRLAQHDEGTHVHLAHEFADDAVCSLHVQGWRYQMAVFGNVTANDAFSGAAELVDGWLAAWSEPDAAARDAMLDRIASPDVAFRDQFSLVDGLEDLRPHLAAVHRFMPGLRLVREGDVRHCQGTVLADWVARDQDGQTRGSGTNVFVMDPHGRIKAVTGFWNTTVR
jgi:uncharacterized protein YndB with AHSA1/START domain